MTSVLELPVAVPPAEFQPDNATDLREWKMSLPRSSIAEVASIEDIKTLRNVTGLSQARFAELAGMPLRTYEDIERGVTSPRLVHIRAAQMAVLLHQAKDH